MTGFTPPYPKPLTSRLGLLARLSRMRRDILGLLREQNYRMKLGHFRFPGLNIFVVNEPALVRRVMVTETDRFPKATVLRETVKPIIGYALFTANGADWRRQRNMIDPAFGERNLEELFPLMRAAADTMLARLADGPDGRSIDTDIEMSHVTADVICRTMFSLPFERDDLIAMFDAFDRFQNAAPTFGLMRALKLPTALLPSHWRLHRACADVHRLMRSLVRERLAMRDAGQGDDRTDILTSLIKARDPETGAPFDEDELMRQVTMLFIAGHETTANSVSWAIYCLANCPELQDRAFAEVERVAPGRDIEFADIRKLTFIRNVFRETLRLYPALSFLFREASEQTEMRGQTVCPHDTMVVAPWIIHRHRAIWDRPDEFDPDRYDRAETRKSLKDGYIPFGGGSRVCIGAGFAMQEGVMLLAMLVRRFRFRPDPDHEPRIVSRATLRSRNGVRVLIDRRQAP